MMFEIYFNDYIHIFYGKSKDSVVNVICEMYGITEFDFEIKEANAIIFNKEALNIIKTSYAGLFESDSKHFIN